MGSQVALGVGVVALILAIAAFGMAVLANRRWVRRERTGAPSAALPLAEVREIALAQKRLAEQIADLQESLRTEVGAAKAERDDSLAALRTEVAQVADDLVELGAASRTALRRVAVVRYDAFADVGGRLSYSVAVLDDTSSGLVLTALSGKSDTRTYVKAVSAGAGESQLTPEEEQAVAAAAGSNP